MYQTMQKALGEWDMKIKFICFHSEEWNKLACVRIWSKGWIWGLSYAREEVAGWEVKERKKRKAEDEQGLIWITSWSLMFEAVSLSMVTQRQKLFHKFLSSWSSSPLLFSILHAYFFYHFRNDKILDEGRFLSVLSHTVHSSFANEEMEQSWKDFLKN